MWGFEGGCGMDTRCLWKGGENVGLVRVGVFRENGESKFVYGYVARVMRVLYGMREGERDELGLVMGVGLRRCRVCRVFGLWYNEEDDGVYMVSERFSGGLLEKLDYSGTELVGRDEEGMGGSNVGGVLGLAMVGMEMCETIIGLHSEGLNFGSLGLSCFAFDDFGHACIDISEVLVMGMRVRKIFIKAVSSKDKSDREELEVSLKNHLLEVEGFVFVSPELFFELMPKKATDLGSSSPRYTVGYGSDVWSLACVLIWLLVGKSFMEAMNDYLCCFVPLLSDGEGLNCETLYTDWLEKVNTLLETRLGSEFVSLKDNLFSCLRFDPESRPVLTDVWKCIRELVIMPKFDMIVNLRHTVTKKKMTNSLVQGELCQLLMETNEGSNGQKMKASEEEEENGITDHVEKLRIDRDIIDGLSGGHVKCIDLKGHLDCITGLAVGGGFLFSSSFDKTVQIWSLEDFTHIHSFSGHEHKVMAVVFVDEEQPLCISGDSGGGICVWGISVPFKEEPSMKLYEEKDWRYSGIHALAVSGTGYFYTGSGDRSIKAWSMQTYTVSCTLTGHKSVVSTLAVCNGILYSGSWDGTVRLWCLSDHSPLTVLGENSPGNVISVLCLAADQHVLVAAHESGHLKIWSDNVLLKSAAAQDGAILSVSMKGKWIFTGGWSKTVTVQALEGDDSSVEAVPIGSISCSSVITTLLYWQGTLFVGQADRGIKVYRYGV